MRVLWICGLPEEIRAKAWPDLDCGGKIAWSWIMGHLPPPDDVDLHLLCPVARGPWRPAPVRFRGAAVHLLRVPRGRMQTSFLPEIIQAGCFARRLKPDVVHGWGTEASFGLIARLVSPRHHVVQVQGLINAFRPHLGTMKGTTYLAWLERQTLARSKHVFVESEFSRSITEPFCGRSTRITRIDHPLRAPFLEESLTAVRSDTVLYVGTLDERKGWEDAVAAFLQASAKGWQLKLIGRGTAEATNRLRSMVEQHPGVLVHIPQTSVEDMVRHMKEAAVFLLPSYMDTGPTALKEALAMGLWPVCYDNSGPREYIGRYHYGSLAPTGHVDELTRVLSSALQERPWLMDDRMASVSTLVRKDLSSVSIWAKLLPGYQEIL
jgi:glycosyltransferase involved in cell wall biosynthesis